MTYFFKCLRHVSHFDNWDKNKRHKHFFLISGVDIERWYLKSLIGFVKSGNMQLNGEPLDSGWLRKEWANLLVDENNWPEHTGLYVTGKIGERIRFNGSFAFAGMFTRSGQLIGITSEFCGLELAVLLVSQRNLMDEARWRYRPTLIQLRKGRERSAVGLSY
jgi:hypothetical protein